MKVIGKHKEILIELLIHYLDNMESNHTIMKRNLINNVKKQNIDGEWYIKYYIDNFMY